MCGIVGYFKQENSTSKFDLQEAAEVMHHRGPDDRSIVNEKSFHIAFNRLSIIDLSKDAMQPFRMDGVTAYMNGEIYNHLELKKMYQKEFVPKTGSDAEIIPFLYKKFGLSFLNQINGMFAMVIIDDNIGKQFLILDRFGVKPMHYALRDSILFFASEMKALFKILDFDLDKRNINIAFNIIQFPYPLTPFKDLFKVSPGTFIEYDNGKIREKRWYYLKLNERINDVEYLETRFDELFEQSIRYRLRSDVPVGSFLSGGLDSSSIAVSAAKQYKEYNKEFHVFNGVVEGKEGLTDNVNAIRLARENGLTYHEVKIGRKFYEDNIVSLARNFDEILFEAGCMNFYAVQQEARKYVTVMLDGIGGDEIFMGYVKYLWFKKFPMKLVDSVNKLTPHSQTLRRILTCLNRKRGSKIYDLLVDKMLFFIRLMEYIPAGFFGTDSHYDEGFLRENIRRNLKTCEEAIGDDFCNMLGYLDYFNLTGLQNVFSDRTGMAYSIEGRNPYEDYELVEFALSINSDLKIDKKLTKKLFRKFHAKRLPDYILNAPKMGFSSPLQKWIFSKELHKPYRDYIEYNKDIILDIIGEYAYKKVMYHKSYDRIAAMRWHVFMAYILWYKIHIEKIKLDNPHISIYEFFNNYQ